LARLIVRSREQASAAEFSERLAAMFHEAQKRLGAEASAMRLLGPAEAPVFRLKGYYRYHFQLQSPSAGTLHRLLKAVVPTVRHRATWSSRSTSIHVTCNDRTSPQREQGDARPLLALRAPATRLSGSSRSRCG
jgi:primosomal protein N'